MKRLLRPIFQKVASMVGIPTVQHRLDKLEQRILPSGATPNVFSAIERRAIDLAMAQLTPLREEIYLAMAQLTPLREELAATRTEMASIAAHAENRLISLNESLVSYVDAKQEIGKETITEFIHQQSGVISQLRQSLDALRRQVGSSTVQPARTSVTDSQASPIDDALYVALENHFRGSRDLVAERQRDYLPKLPAVINSSAPLIDLGCGRGEWLKVVRSQGLPAIGVDTNSVCIAECKEDNLDVIQQDIVDFLANRPDASVGTYTMFQVLEHLPFATLVNVLREIRRTLAPGGRLIAEVPNAKNLRVSAGTFWIDPTHQRPLFPELLIFLATEVGFSQTESHYTNNLSPDYDLTGLPDGARSALQSVVSSIDGPGDFALIATA